MTALPDVPGVARVQLRYSDSEDLDVINRFYLGFTGSWFGPDSGGVHAGAIKDEWVTNVAAMVSESVQLTEVVLTGLQDTSAAVSVWTGTEAGTRSGATNPASICALLNMKVNRRYRGGKPRLYFPYLVASDRADGQTWSPTPITDLESAWANFLAGISASVGWGAGNLNGGPVSVSYYSGVEPPVTLPSGRVKQASKARMDPVVDVVIDYTVNPHFGSQRRRNLIKS